MQGSKAIMPEALGLGLIQTDPQRGASWRAGWTRVARPRDDRQKDLLRATAAVEELKVR